MDEKLSDLRRWLNVRAEESFTPDEAGAYYNAVDEFDERFGA